ncbi:MAG: ATP-dependent DNA helicase [bacterium]|nr:ATP-dependent DNA helicase [bacterium]
MLDFSEFTRLYNTLNSAQKQAVDTIEGPVMVVAGPGTGKTTVLTLRIANILLKTDTPPDGILALTFTEAGVVAMKKKLREIIGVAADLVRVHTFHGLALSLSREFPEEFPFISGALQLNEVEAEGLVTKILENTEYLKLRPFGRPEQYVAPTVSAISDCKKEAVSPDDARIFIKKKIEEIKSDDASYSTRGKTKGQLKAEAQKKIEKAEKTMLFADVFEEYENQKRKLNRYDYDDIILELVKAFETSENFLRLVQERFLYVLVDEHQDTNDSQNKMIKAISDFFDNPNVFIVGDEKQAIFRFQGASVENFLKFENIWTGMTTIGLSDNYRSHQHILDAAFAMIEQNYEGDENKKLRIKLTAAGEGGAKPVSVAVAESENDLENYLAFQVQEILEKDILSEVAVITRTNKALERITRVFSMRNIPFSAEKSVDIFSSGAGALFFDCLDFAADNSMTESLAMSLIGGAWDVSFEDRVKLSRGLKSGITGTHALWQKLRKISEKSRHADPVEFLYFLARESGMEKLFSQTQESAEIWRGIISFAEKIQSEDQGKSVSSLAEIFRTYRNSKRRRNVKVWVGKTEARVKVCTAHGSKGLEFDYVFLPFSTEKQWLKKDRREYFLLPKKETDGDDVKDERRLFYVALTRAKKHAEILLSKKDSAGSELLPLRFISELDPKSVEYSAIKDLGKNTELFPKQNGLEDGALDGKLVEYAKHVLSDTGLSVTALNHFLECPRKFLYKSVLKVPEPPSAVAEKGTALHEGISSVWRSAVRDEEGVKNIMGGRARHYLLDESFLPKFEKDAVLKELEDELPKITASLLPHFKTSDKVFAESWYEKEFVAVLSHNTKISIRLHGKLDAVLVGDKKVSVFDYKSRHAMSPAAIRGETKSEDGRYFRQLVFYKILVNDNPKFKGMEQTLSLYFIKPDKNDDCKPVALFVSDKDMEDLMEKIKILLKSVWSGEFLKVHCDNEDCVWCRLKESVTGHTIQANEGMGTGTNMTRPNKEVGAILKR